MTNYNDLEEQHKKNKIMLSTLRYILNLSQENRDKYFDKLHAKDPTKYELYLNKYYDYLKKKNNNI